MIVCLWLSIRGVRTRDAEDEKKTIWKHWESNGQYYAIMILIITMYAIIIIKVIISSGKYLSTNINATF